MVPKEADGFNWEKSEHETEQITMSVLKIDTTAQQDEILAGKTSRFVFSLPLVTRTIFLVFKLAT